MASVSLAFHSLGSSGQELFLAQQPISCMCVDSALNPSYRGVLAQKRVTGPGSHSWPGVRLWRDWAVGCRVFRVLWRPHLTPTEWPGAHRSAVKGIPRSCPAQVAGLGRATMSDAPSAGSSGSALLGSETSAVIPFLGFFSFQKGHPFRKPHTSLGVGGPESLLIALVGNPLFILTFLRIALQF